jgi:hypothetical protein
LRGAGESGVIGVGRLMEKFMSDSLDVPNDIEFTSIFSSDYSSYVHELLEDFEVLGQRKHMALICRDDDLVDLRANVLAASLTSYFGLKSVDSIKHQYADFLTADQDDISRPQHAYVDAYRCVKKYIWKMHHKLKTKGLPQPSLGVFGAGLVLDRLLYSFFCAHFLYRLGHRYEGHAISRLILEQIAWAYAAHNLDDVKDIAKIKTTQSITSLKCLYPEASHLYGFLSKKTHIDYTNHFEFLRIKNGKNAILHAQPEFEEYAQVLFTLGDVFGIVWELSQFDYIKKHEAIEINKKGVVSIRSDRPFLAEMRKHLEIIREFVSENSPQSEHDSKNT